MKKASLNTPYGGKLIQRMAPRAAGSAPGNSSDFILTINEIVVSDLINIATGAFSPLTGFMGSKEFASVCKEDRLAESGLPWTIPIVCDISDDEKVALERNKRVELRAATSGKTVGWLEPSEIYPHDKKLHIAATFGTNDSSHPGVERVLAMKAWLVAGKVTLYEDSVLPDPLAHPTGVREMMTRMQLTRVAGFQTRNVVHRAHEHLQRLALEVVGGLLVHPVVGWKKAGDFRPEVVQRGYRHFIDSYFPKDKVILAFLTLAMRYAGPREAVFHAIIRKNYGCSHFIVGRDHAGVGGFYGTYAAHEIFDTLPELGIEILRLREPFYCARCEGVTTDRACGHAESERKYISGTRIRKILNDGSDPAGHIFRTEVLAALSVFKKEELFFE